MFIQLEEAPISLAPTKIKRSLRILRIVFLEINFFVLFSDYSCILQIFSYFERKLIHDLFLRRMSYSNFMEIKGGVHQIKIEIKFEFPKRFYRQWTRLFIPHIKIQRLFSFL